MPALLETDRNRTAASNEPRLGRDRPAGRHPGSLGLNDEHEAGLFSNARLTGWLVALIAVWTLVVVPFRLLGNGWIPPDDARRHAAKVVSDRSWNEILVLRDEATVDPHPGWHAVLSAFERIGIRTTPGLVKVSVVVLSLLVLLAPLPFLARPEAWLLALVTAALFDPAQLPRFFFGRPLVFTMAVLLVVCAVWPRLRAERAPLGLLGGLAAAIAASTWIHGNWYLWALPLAAFVVAGERRAALRLAACAGVGCVLGAVATGHPLSFLGQTLAHPVWALGDSAPLRVRVSEFHPSNGSPLMLLAVAALLLWRAQSGRWRRDVVVSPLFALVVVSWLLGLKVLRFWSDWGLPALLVWMAFEYQELLDARLVVTGRRRLALAAAAAAALFLAVTADTGSRWSKFPATRLPSLEQVEYRAWLPEPGGTVYSNELYVFYDLFFQHPHADWRYQLGFEPSLMPPRDLAIFRRIVLEGASDASLRPWAERLRPEDRMIVKRASSRAPALAGLEWVSPQRDFWVGRRVRDTAALPPESRGAATPVVPEGGLESEGPPDSGALDDDDGEAP